MIPQRSEPLPPWLRRGHHTVIFLFFVQMLYIGWQVFVVWQPPGTFGPVFGGALEMPYEDMMVRRMYAIEGDLAAIGLVAYLAITEILPRRLRPASQLPPA